MSMSARRHVTQPAPPRAGGVVMGTPVMTVDGEIPVEYLNVGDRIITRAGVCKLASVSVRVDRGTQMVRIGAGTLGHDRPCAETLVPADQMILIRDWRAKALYGAAQVLVAAARLADGAQIRIETVAEARVFTLGFDADVVLFAGGLEIACLRETVGA